jgi:hypothetical protein
MGDSIDKVLASRGQPSVLGQAAPVPASEGNEFFGILVGEGEQEHFLELRLNIGLKTCFSYTDLQFFNYDPEDGSLMLDFGLYAVTLRGRGLGDKLFHGIRRKKVAWVKEADSKMQGSCQDEHVGRRRANCDHRYRERHFAERSPKAARLCAGRMI